MNLKKYKRLILFILEEVLEFITKNGTQNYLVFQPM